MPVEELQVCGVLVEMVWREHGGNQGHVAFHLCAHECIEYRLRYELVAIDPTVDHEGGGHDGVVAPAVHCALCKQRNLEGARDAEHLHPLLCDPQLRQLGNEGGTTALEQAFVPRGLNECDATVLVVGRRALRGHRRFLSFGARPWQAETIRSRAPCPRAAARLSTSFRSMDYMELADRNWPLLRFAIKGHTALYRATNGLIG